MASSIEENITSIENNATSLVNGKHADRIENEKKKIALGDIKNAQAAPQVSSDGKTVAKKTEIQNVETPPEYASSRPVDMYDVMVEKLTFSDEMINTWVKSLNIGWTDTYDDIEPPPPLTFCPIEPFMSNSCVSDIPDEDDFLPLIPELPLLPECSELESDSSEYQSCETSFEEGEDEEQKPSPTSNFYNDSDISALNQSVFDLSSDDDWMNSF